MFRMVVNHEASIEDMHSRAVAAVIKNNAILMVRHEHDSRVYWTLPGGGREPSETWEQAAVRELYEETGLRAKTARLLYQTDNEVCFEITPEDAMSAYKGYDPELGPDEQMITAIGWIPLSEMEADIQVSRVIAVRGRSR